ncbi:SixA phosphatase family protein [Aureimonas mangrovi]|uniref:SixA phosphatase family protein n=1 Tax=Aureimonas mangrovi TaxID=2758041 RepID=UPI00163D40B5|nr:histidine phosphatase family protein [Aureimonas mangrovi]
MITRTLFILRHARATAPLPGQRDYDRALDARGWEDGKALGRLMRDREMHVRRTVTSGALRTRQTCDALVAGGFGINPATDDDLYHGKTDRYRAVADRYGDDDLLIVGHNPMISDFVLTLVQPSAANGDFARGLRKCALAIVTEEKAASPRFVLKELIEPPFST